MTRSQTRDQKLPIFFLVVVGYVVITLYLAFFRHPIPFMISLFSILLAVIALQQAFRLKNSGNMRQQAIVLFVGILTILSVLGLAYVLGDFEQDGFGLIGKVYRTNTDAAPIYIRRIQPADDAEYPQFAKNPRNNRFPNLPETLPFYVENLGFLWIPQHGDYQFRVTGVESPRVVINGTLVAEDQTLSLSEGLYPFYLNYWKMTRSLNVVPTWHRTDGNPGAADQFEAIPATSLFPSIEAFEHRHALLIKRHLPGVLLILWLPVAGYFLCKLTTQIAFRKAYLPYALLIGVLLTGISLRWLLLTTTLQFPDADEATLGIMALKMLRGESFLVSYGNAYTGSFDAILTAIFFVIFGVNNLALKLYPLVASVLVIYTTYRLGRVFYSPAVGVLAALFTAIGSPFMLEWSLKLTGGHVPVLVLGNILFLLTYRVVFQQRGTPRTYGILGFLAGMAFWIHSVSVVYILTTVVFLWLADKKFWLKKTGALFCLYFVIGALPLIVGNWQTGFQTVQYFSASDLPFFHKILRSPDNLRNMIESVLTIMGLSSSLGIDQIPLLKYSLLAIYAGLGGYLLLTRDKGIAGFVRFSLRDSDGTEMFLVLAALTSALYLYSSFGYAPGTGRYFIPLFALLPILLARCVIWISQRHFTIALGIVVIVIYVNVLGNFRLATASLDLTQKDLTHVVQFLERHRIHYLIGNYWVVGRIVFESDERILGVRQPPISFLPYDEIIAQQDVKDVAYIAVSADDADVNAVGAEIRESYQQAAIGDFTVYVHPDFEIRP